MTNDRPDILEQPVIIKTGRQRFTLGVPRIDSESSRLAMLTPEGASMLVAQNIEVRVERGAGQVIHYPDERYGQAGAEICTRTRAFGADVVLYSGLPSPAEISLMRPGSILLTMLACLVPTPENISMLLTRRITVFALDCITDAKGNTPVKDIIGEVSGRAAIALAGAFLSDTIQGKGILLGGVAGINPCEVVILGTGMTALAAARGAIGAGSMVRMFDSDPYNLRKAQGELGPAVIGSAMHPRVLGHALAGADVVIATAMDRTFAIDGSVIDSMKKGVVIFDLADHNGISGVFPTLRCTDVSLAMRHGIAPSSAVCLTNAACAVPRTSAMAMTNDIIPIVDRLFHNGAGLENTLKTDPGLRAGALFFRGHTVNRDIARRLKLRHVDINLLLSFS